MHILIFAHFAGSPDHGMVYGHYFLAQEWVLAGHSVTIVAAGYAHTRFKQPRQMGKVFSETIDGIRYVWLPTPKYTADSALGRVRNITGFSLRCLFNTLYVKQADLVICSSHHPFTIFAAQRYARRFQARLVFEVRDLWPLTLIELGGMSKYNPFIFLMQRAEDYAYKHADCVVSVLPGAKKYMVGRGMDPGKFVYIPNGASLRDQDNEKPLPAEHLKELNNLKKAGVFIIGYAGRLGLANELHTLIRALAVCDDQSIAVALLGYGIYANELKSLVKELGVTDRVIFLGPVMKLQVPDFLNRIDAAYIGVKRSPLYRFGVSFTKLNDIMMAGKPVVFAADLPGNIVMESGSGITCPPEDPQALGQALVKMKAMGNDERDAMGKKGRDWVIKNHDFKLLAGRFLQAIQKNIVSKMVG